MFPWEQIMLQKMQKGVRSFKPKKLKTCNWKKGNMDWSIYINTVHHISPYLFILANHVCFHSIHTSFDTLYYVLLFKHFVSCFWGPHQLYPTMIFHVSTFPHSFFCHICSMNQYFCILGFFDRHPFLMTHHLMPTSFLLVFVCL